MTIARAVIFTALMLGATLAWGEDIAHKKWCWEPSTTRIDRSPYLESEMAGYRFYCGDSRHGPFFLTLDIEHSGTTCVDLEHDVDTSYCYITAYDTEGNESGPSNRVGSPMAPQGATFGFE